MVMVRQIINSGIVFFLWCLPVHAQEMAPLDIRGQYDFTLASIPFGRLDITAVQDASHYDASSDIAMVGIAKIFVQHESHTTSHGSGADYLYPDVEYASNYSTRGKKKTAMFTKKGGVITEDKVTPPDDPSVRPPVATPMKSAAYDPVSVALGMRLKTVEMLKGGKDSFTIDYYDGRRLTRATFKYDGEKMLKIGKRQYPVYTLIGSRVPLAGFTKKELDRMKDKEPPLYVYVSKETLIPIRLEVQMLFGTAAATLRMK